MSGALAMGWIAAFRAYSRFASEICALNMDEVIRNPEFWLPISSMHKI